MPRSALLEKKCPGPCGQVKPRSAFNLIKRANGETQIAYYCKECQKIYKHNWRLRNYERERAKERERIEAKRLKLLDASGSNAEPVVDEYAVPAHTDVV